MFGSRFKSRIQKLVEIFYALLFSSFIPTLRRLKVDRNMHTLITKLDVQEIFGLRAFGYLPLMGESTELESLASTYDPKCGPPKGLHL